MGHCDGRKSVENAASGALEGDRRPDCHGGGSHLIKHGQECNNRVHRRARRCQHPHNRPQGAQPGRSRR
jgi:hypothetical protein